MRIAAISIQHALQATVFPHVRELVRTTGHQATNADDELRRVHNQQRLLRVVALVVAVGEPRHHVVLWDIDLEVRAVRGEHHVIAKSCVPIIIAALVDAVCGRDHQKIGHQALSQHSQAASDVARHRLLRNAKTIRQQHL